ncbi:MULTISPECIES: phosphatidylglycerophosphatase A family protein [Tepidiphilus]|jgi:phosphatidylglycerophosphatase A|uniref:Phosphatidylglycerophosphatase A n=1 Tax=Tepidiphilus thermophilus TaxID=876478 RepID=A0A0K6IWY9_9PROT|nr:MULTISPECIES: phosphatidylglycerophosphatase A [Tepidiphilus]CUB07630.1 Phosphatidylglycerophosphatase A [Tepidiphilus thermophilus]
MTAERTRPTAAFLLAHPAHFIALGFGSGLSPWAPGTVGSLLAWALYPLLRSPVSEGVFLLLLVSFFLAGILACERTAKALGSGDPGAVVWDEMLAVWLVLFFCPPGLAWQAAGVALFRLFDIAKPEPIATLERRFRGGLGIMIDDLAAAGYVLLVLAVAVHFLGGRA